MLRLVMSLSAPKSKGTNKAVIAEVGIRKARAILREMELKLNLKNIETGSSWKIEKSNLAAILTLVQDRINLKAKIREPKPQLLPTAKVLTW
jgi:hypothetical protein